jgi:transposase InsO family protein
MIQHYEQVSRHVCQTRRFFGISRSQFYVWLRRHRETRVEGLQDRPRGPHISPYRIPPEIEALILHLRKERQYGAVRRSYYLRRYHQVFVSAPTILRVFRENQAPRVSLKRYHPRPRVRRETLVPGQSVQVDVKFLKGRSGRFYQFTAIDEATRYRVLKLFGHNTIKSAVDFDEELRRRLPFAIQRITTDHGSEFGTDFTWHLHDLGIDHRYIPRGYPESNGKVERNHRTDQEEFYRRVRFRTLEELQTKLRTWEHEYNHLRPHLALKGQTPVERLCELRVSVPQPVRRTP